MRDVKEFYNWFIVVKVSVVAMHCEPNCETRKGEHKIRRGEHRELVVTKAILLEYKEHLINTKLKVSTINSKISSLNSYFTYTEKETLKLKVLKCQKSLFGSKEKELTKYEFNKLYNAAKGDDRLRLIIVTIVKTGIRVSELKYITRESLDMGRAIVNNKGKTRVILIPRKLCKKLKDYCKGFCSGENKTRRDEHKIRRGCYFESVFLTRNGTPIDRKQIWQMMKNLADKAGVPKEKVFPHNLRHLFAREFYKETKDIVKLASILGHSSIETARIYTKETKDECGVELEKVMVLIE